MINVFNYIAEAVEALELERDLFVKGANKLSGFLEKQFESAEDVVGVTFRVKTAASFKEKIVRNSLYKQCDSSEVARNMSDIIGIRIECRFLDDEARVFRKLVDMFCCTNDGVYFFPETKKGIRLKLGTPQPEYQKNGLEIYRIDGEVDVGTSTLNFELQIKSLVNSFWSEIEHKIIYKNKRFMMIDSFVNELMITIHAHLVNIDHELNMLYHRCLGVSTVDKKIQVENLLGVFLNDIYSEVVQSCCGFSVNIKAYSEALVKYIFNYSSFVSHRTDNDIFGNTIINVLNWLKTIDYSQINIGKEIVFDVLPTFENKLEQAIANKFIENINADFYVNTFFHILFSLEVGNDSQDFNSYIKYYATRLREECVADETLIQRVAPADACKMLVECGIKKLSDALGQ